MAAPSTYQFVKDFLSSMSKRRMSDVMGEGRGFSYFGVKAPKFCN